MTERRSQRQLRSTVIVTKGKALREDHASNMLISSWDRRNNSMKKVQSLFSMGDLGWCLWDGHRWGCLGTGWRKATSGGWNIELAVPGFLPVWDLQGRNECEEESSEGCGKLVRDSRKRSLLEEIKVNLQFGMEPKNKVLPFPRHRRHILHFVVGEESTGNWQWRFVNWIMKVM